MLILAYLGILALIPLLVEKEDRITSYNVCYTKLCTLSRGAGNTYATFQYICKLLADGEPETRPAETAGDTFVGLGKAVEDVLE